MTLVLGKYQLLKNVNLEEYYRSVGCNFWRRRCVSGITPTLEVRAHGDIWTIDFSEVGQIVTKKFKLGEEYEEEEAGEMVNSKTTVKGDTLTTVSTLKNGTKTTKIYEFNEKGCILKLKHIDSGVEAIRLWKRL